MQKQDKFKRNTCLVKDDKNCIDGIRMNLFDLDIPLRLIRYQLKLIISYLLSKYMKSSHIILLSLLVIAAHSVSLLSYAIPYNNTVGSLNEYYTPAYQLGTLSFNNSITITVSFPGGTNDFLQTFVRSLTLYYYDFTTGTFADSLLYDFTGETVLTTTYTSPSIPITFLANSLYNSSRFILDVSKSNLDLSTAGAFFTYYYLQVNYFPTATGISVVNPASLSTLLKVVDVCRRNIVKVIYISQQTPVFNFTFYPALSASPPIVRYYYFPFGNVSITGFLGNQILTGPFDTLTSIQDANGSVYVNNLAHYSMPDTITPGFYALEFDLQNYPIPYANTVRISFNTDPYSCPYSSDYGDFYSNFQGCSAPLSPNGYPCASFDTVTQSCSLCIPGYTLVNGSCYVNTTCPARQYFSYGVCVNASATCGDFDKFTGNCLNCSDPANYYLANGSCLRRSVTCGPRQWQTNYTCYNVSSTCDTYDINTGNCLTCISNLYQLNSNGTCTLIIVVCPQGQYTKELSCITIPIECLKFNIGLEKCQGCIKGYFVENGACKRIVCPNGQVPSDYGIFCVNVSPLCGDYDAVSGNCLTCKNTGYTVRNGKCLQETSPLAGCQQRQHLGFGPCVGADVNCKTFNLQSGNCDECIANFYLDYTGRCAENAKCGVGQWSVNGDCIGIPDNCIRVDELGLCTRCINNNYRLHQGQCVYFKSCASQQYLNAGGQCVNVSPNCATWNPSNGQCITCKLANTHPSGGVCCPAGQVYSSGKCVSSNTLQNSYQNAVGSSCLIRHPSLTICLKCAQGYGPVYTLPYACSKVKN